MKRNGCLGVGELALEGNREETADDTMLVATLVATESALLGVLPAVLRCFAIVANSRQRNVIRDVWYGVSIKSWSKEVPDYNSPSCSRDPHGAYADIVWTMAATTVREL